ncbi:lipopolysaccharide biosynthesis protein [Maribacter chungangensis]|uniref:Lipopolysaccharide biosynthesis protein n=1 Tax=Maribacter chungangensis TaxID=1069117 RepID=A0ABW3B9P5_9FLAO
MIKNSRSKMVIMYGSSIAGILLGFLISVLHTKLLGAEKFGDFKFIETVVRFIGSLVSVGFFISLTRLLAINDDRIKERKYVGLFTIVFLIISLIGIILILLFSFIEPYFFGHGLSIIFRKYFFVVSAVIGQLALNEILKGMHKINYLVIFNVIPGTVYVIILYFLSFYLTIGVEFILFLYYLLIFLAVVVAILYLKPKFNFDKKMYRTLLVENKHNGRPIYYGSLAGVATTHIAGFSISYYLTNTEVGFYMLALTVCSPILIVPSVLGTIYFKEFVHLKSIPRKVLGFSFLFTCIALIIFYLLIETVVVYVYGDSFLPVSVMSKYLIFGFILHGLGDLFNRFLGAKGKGKLLRNAAFLVGVVNVIGYTVFISLFDINGAILTKILASCLYMSVMIYYYFNFDKN